MIPSYTYIKHDSQDVNVNIASQMSKIIASTDTPFHLFMPTHGNTVLHFSTFNTCMMHRQFKFRCHMSLRTEQIHCVKCQGVNCSLFSLFSSSEVLLLSSDKIKFHNEEKVQLLQIIIIHTVDTKR